MYMNVSASNASSYVHVKNIEYVHVPPIKFQYPQEMECYATHLIVWRAAKYCGILWLPLPPPSPLFLSLSYFFPPDLV